MKWFVRITLVKMMNTRPKKVSSGSKDNVIFNYLTALYFSGTGLKLNLKNNLYF